MTNSFTKLPLSASIYGKQISLPGTASSTATEIHTATATAGSIDEVWIYAYNDATSTVQLSILWGGTTEPQDVSRVGVPSKSGRTLVVDGKLIGNGLIVKAYAAVSGSILIDGFVNRITTS